MIRVRPASLLVPAVVAAGAVGWLVPSTSAAAAGCTLPQLTTRSGLAIVQIRKSGVTCATARQVARRAVGAADGSFRKTFTTSGRTWRCRLTQATGTDDGYDPRTKIRCTSGSARVRFELSS